MHGAGGGAPQGNRNALKHGEFTAEALTLKREIQALARMARKTLVAIE
jgi:glucans biosynthesis protein